MATPVALYCTFLIVQIVLLVLGFMSTKRPNSVSRSIAALQHILIRATVLQTVNYKIQTSMNISYSNHDVKISMSTAAERTPETMADGRKTPLMLFIIFG